jgi:ABC-type oligopeptide transport system substrate-binding subunit
MSDQNWANDPEQVQSFLKRAEAGGMDRRTFLRILAAAGASSAILAACGPAATPAPANTSAPAPVNTPAPGATTAPAPVATNTAAPAAVVPPKAGAPVPDAEQVFREGRNAEPSSFDFNGDLYNEANTEVWAGLMRFDFDYKAVPYGAKTVDIKDNVWTFNLDPNWKWTNGDQVTANDFEWSWLRMLHPAVAAPYSSLLYDVKGAEAFNQRKDLKGTNDELTPAASGVGVKALDKTKFEVTLNGPRGFFGAIVAYYAALPNHRPTVEKNGETFKTDALKSSEPGVIVTNGPHKLTKWDHNKGYVFERNDGFALEPKAKLRKVIFTIIDNAAQLASYEKNELDRSHVSPSELPRVRNDPKLSKELISYSASGAFYLVPNPNMKPFDVKGVRRALEHAIDRDAIVKNVLQGVSKPAFTFDPPDLPQYIDPAKFPEILPLTKYDPKLAMAELVGTPYEGGKNWPPIKLEYRTQEETLGSTQSIQAIQAMLKDNLNMSIELVPLEQKVFRPNMWDHKQQFTWVRWYSDYPDSNNNLYQVWYSGSGAAGHRHDFANKQFDDLVTAAKSPPNNDDRVKLYAQAEVVGLNEGYATYVYYLYTSRVYKPWIGNLPKNSRGEFVQDENIWVGMFETVQIVEADGRPKLS